MFKQYGLKHWFNNALLCGGVSIYGTEVYIYYIYLTTYTYTCAYEQYGKQLELNHIISNTLNLTAMTSFCNSYY